MAFWILVVALALTVSLFLARALLAGGRGDEHPAAYDLKVYRDQLKEVERDLARGIVNPDDAERARVEISRKVLAADAQLQAAESEQGSGNENKIAAFLVMALVLIGGGVATYQQLGAPGYGDFGLKSRIAAADEARENRPSQAEAESKLPDLPPATGASDYVLDLIERLREAVAQNPDDIQGLELLATNEANLGNFKAAYQTQSRLIQVKGENAVANDFTALAEMLTMAANGYISPEAEAALDQALRRDEEHPIARYYVGLMMAQSGRPDVTFRIWRALLDEGPADAPWIAPIRAQILNAASLAGVDYELPEVANLAGPSAADIEAASDMTADEQRDMIRNMVQSLSERLATQGGTAAEWSRLISSLGVLGDTEQASAIWNEAQVVFAGDPNGLETVRDGAIRAGVAE